MLKLLSGPGTTMPLLMSIVLLAVFLLVVTVLTIQPAQATRADVGAPITVWSQLVATAEVIGPAETVLLAGFGADPDAPLDLALVWHKDTSGWLPTWSVQLVSETHDISVAHAPAGSATVHLLATNPPVRDNVYEAVLSYDPATGTVGVVVANVTQQLRLVSHTMTVSGALPPLQLQQRPTGGRLAATITQTAPHYVPITSRWYVMAGDSESRVLSDTVGWHDSKALQLTVPGGHAPGTFRFYAALPDADVPVAELTISQEQHIIELGKTLPAGQYSLMMDYVVDDHVMFSQRRDVSVGRVDFMLGDIDIDAASGHVTGTYNVVGDGPLPGTDVAVDLQWIEMVWNAATGSFDETLHGVQRTVTRAHMEISTEPAHIVFTDEVPAGPPGTVWKAVLTPSLSTRLHTVVHGNEFVTVVPNSPGQRLRLMSFNIRFPTDNDGDHAWDLRTDLLLQVFDDNAPDIIGFQEPWAFQVAFLRDELTDYEGVAFNPHGLVHNALFYKKDRLELLEWDHFWLSDTRHAPGLTQWGGGARGVIWGRFRVRGTDTTVTVLNTHLRAGESAYDEREYGAKLIVDFVDQLPADEAIIVLGDFNSNTSSSTYRVFTQGQPPPLIDARTAGVITTGPEGTFHGFTGDVANRRIDWILFRGPARPLTVDHITLHDGRRYPSDHLPIQADFHVW